MKKIRESFLKFSKQNNSGGILVKLSKQQEEIDDVEEDCFLYQESILTRIKLYPEYKDTFVREWTDFVESTATNKPDFDEYVSYENKIFLDVLNNINNTDEIEKELRKH